MDLDALETELAEHWKYDPLGLDMLKVVRRYRAAREVVIWAERLRAVDMGEVTDDVEPNAPRGAALNGLIPALDAYDAVCEE